jgi:hypothetical protein
MGSMRARTIAAMLALSLSTAHALAQDDEDPYADEEKPDDVVFDNKKLNEELAQKRAKERRDKYQGDSPFAGDKKPDKVEKREDRWSPGMQGGYRAGWGVPLGNAAKGTRFSEALAGMLFLWGDGGYQPIPELMLGIYLSAGYVLPDCDEGATCTYLDFRAGIQGQWRFLPFADFTPWVGIGSGWELFLGSVDTELAEVSSTLHGPELFVVQGGIDIWAPTARGHAGLFVAYSMGRFISVSTSVDGEDVGGDIDPDNHNWLFIGARGTF